MQLHLRTPPRWLFFTSGLCPAHGRLIWSFNVYALLMTLFIAALYWLGQFGAIPSDLAGWQTFWQQLTQTSVQQQALSVLAQSKTVIIIAITLWMVLSTLLLRIAPAISRWHIDTALARTANASFITATKEGKMREQADLLKLVPQGDSSLSSLRAFQRLIQNTSLIAQDSPAAIIDSVRSDIDEEAQRHGSTQRVLLHLGILGTFIGLMLAVPGLTSLFGKEASDEDIRLGLSNLFTALAACFSTSIAGLLGSITVVSATNILRRVHEEHLRTLDDALLTLQGLATSTLLREAGKTEFGSIWTALHQQNERLQKQTDTINLGINSLRGATASISDALKIFDETSQRISELHTLLQGTELASALSKNIVTGLKTGRDMLAESTQKAASAMASTVQSAEKLNSAIDVNRRAIHADTEMTHKIYEDLSAQLLGRVREDGSQAMAATLAQLQQTVGKLDAELRAHALTMRGSPWYRCLHFANRVGSALRDAARAAWTHIERLRS